MSPNEPLAKCAREQANLGNIRSDVVVDGIPVAKLDVKMSLVSGKLDYKINSLLMLPNCIQKILILQYHLTLISQTKRQESGVNN
jgi:hypothetical protein